jgi:hypothetical protein
MGKSAAHKQDQRRAAAGGHKAKETIRRVGELKSAKAKKGTVTRMKTKLGAKKKMTKKR